MFLNSITLPVKSHLETHGALGWCNELLKSIMIISIKSEYILFDLCCQVLGYNT